MKNEDVTTRWDSLLNERAALEKERHDNLVATGIAPSGIVDRLTVIRKEMAALNEVFQGQDHPNNNADFAEVFRPVEVTEAFDAAFGLDPDAPENRLDTLRNAREEIEKKAKAALLPADLDKLRAIDQGIAQALFEIHTAALVYWRKIDAGHPRVKEHQKALEEITVKHPDLVAVENDPVAVEVDVPVDPVAVVKEYLAFPNFKGITLEDVKAYPRAGLGNIYNTDDSVKNANRELDALEMFLAKDRWAKGQLKRQIKSEIYQSLKPNGEAADEINRASIVDKWLGAASELIISKQRLMGKK